MDLILAACQGLGLSLAAGMVAGALAGTAGEGARIAIGVLLVAAAIAGAVLFGLSLETEDHPAWPGWPVGALLAALAFGVARGVVAGAAARAGERGSPAAIVMPIVLFALVLAGLSLLLPPVALVAAVAIGLLASRRRRRAEEKYEGLRTLR